jgi:hypothetical protein
MNSLTDAYTNQNMGQQYKRKLVGKLLVGIGFSLIIVGLASSTTQMLEILLDFGVEQIIMSGTAIIGFSILVLFTGVLLTLPTLESKSVTLWAIGTVLSVSGVLAFLVLYPESWSIYEPSTITLVAFIYGSGIGVVVYTLFTAIINVKVRNKPGGQVEVVLDTEGETQSFTVQRESAGKQTAEKVERVLNNSTEGTGSTPKTTGQSSLGYIGNIPDSDPTADTVKAQSEPTTKEKTTKSESDSESRTEEGYLKYK